MAIALIAILVFAVLFLHAALVVFCQALGHPKEEGTVILTRLVATDGSLRPCKLIIRTDAILVVARSPLHPFDTIRVEVHQLEACLVTDKSQGNHSMAGFSVEFDQGQLVFFENGFRPLAKSQKVAGLISAMQSNWYKGTSVPTVPVVNVDEKGIIEPIQLIHRPNQG